MKLTFSKLEFLVEDNTILGRLYRLVYGKPRTTVQLVGLIVNENGRLFLNKDADVDVLWNAIRLDPETSQTEFYIRKEVAERLTQPELEEDYLKFKKKFKFANSSEDWINYFQDCKVKFRDIP